MLIQNYPTKFILASIMGQNEGERESLAKLCEENGAKRFLPYRPI